jgi:replicative DNA helicase
MVHELNFQEYSDRVPPQNIDAEEAILGGILLDPDAIGRVAEFLRPEAFYISAHQDIYRAMLQLQSQGRPTDLMSLTTWLGDQGKLEKVGGQGRLAELIDRTVSAVNIDQYAQLVVDKYLRRNLIRVGTEIAQLGYDTTEPLPKVLDLAEQKVFGITQVRPTQGLVGTADILTDTFSDIESRSLGMVLPGISCGFYDLDAMTQGFQRSDLIIAAARPAMGKCCAADTELVLADGSVATIAEVVQRQAGPVLTLGDRWQFSWTQPSAFVDDGHKPVFRVTTRLGRSVTTTLSHPYLTVQGWRSLSQLQPGDRIAIPRRIPAVGQDLWQSAAVIVLAYLVTDGDLTADSPTFVNNNPHLHEDFAAAIAQFETPTGTLMAERSPSRLRVVSSVQPMTASAGAAVAAPNALRDWLDHLGIWGVDRRDRMIPAPVFRLVRSQVALFLNRLFAADGWATVLASGQCQMGYATPSERLARQVQHLLLRFGIIAALKRRTLGRRITWQLDITDALSLRTFLTSIGIFGKEGVLAKIRAQLDQRSYQTNRDLIPVGIWEAIAQAKGRESWSSLAKRAGIRGHSNLHVGQRGLSRDRLLALAIALDHRELQQLATSDVYWDEIVAIEPLGCQQVYDLTIPHTHNFVANDICLHNTSFVLNAARNIAAFHKLPVAVFSLEMSKEQLVYRLLSSEVQIESGRLRAGRISQHEWEPLGHAISVLSQLPIFIDDTPNVSVNEMRSKARRLQAEKGGALGLILVDYLQLMEGSGDNRVQELSKITRALKGLARELNVPVIALSQLSRGVESRTNKRPMMSDLRESGCLTGDTLIPLADSGRQVPLKDLLGQSNVAIWALNPQTHRLDRRMVSHMFCTGEKPVFKLTTRLGRVIRATANHKFLTIRGWQRLDELTPGMRLAVPSWEFAGAAGVRETVGVGNAGTVGNGRHILIKVPERLSDRTLRVAAAVGSAPLEALANSDIYWDEICSIEPDGVDMVYDMTVPGHHNFVANNIIVHNSIEQDADLVMMLYRDEYYNPDTPDRGITEVIITKHRNGPVGTIRLLFEPQFTRFRNLASPERR